MGELLQTIVSIVQSVFDLSAVTLLLPADGRLAIAASAGEEIPQHQLHQLDPESRIPVGLRDAGTVRGQVASGCAVGVGPANRYPGRPRAAVVRSRPGSAQRLANHAAMAVERAQLEQALRFQLLEEVDRLRVALLGAVSHDLRTPLSSMKVASTTLLDSSITLSEPDTLELHRLIDMQTDRWTASCPDCSISLGSRQGCSRCALHGARSPISCTKHSVDCSTSYGDRPVEVMIPECLPPSR